MSQTNSDKPEMEDIDVETENTSKTMKIILQDKTP